MSETLEMRGISSKSLTSLNSESSISCCEQLKVTFGVFSRAIRELKDLGHLRYIRIVILIGHIGFIIANFALNWLFYVHLCEYYLVGGTAYRARWAYLALMILNVLVFPWEIFLVLLNFYIVR